ncbi:protein PncA [Neisseria zoodegmatis]|uniref:Isochorismatase n=2 Tax=Neisseria zoodegmatis TaxID=326523 RepID=A0AB38DTU6_9NEIS|nr:isochorismatase family protein [Neisseria zoodegmatis]OSI11183.1 isochorismatase [Neisseria zoodegmatis]SNU80526.1 protein PncA [Neisseria zoodegmatis]
MTIIAIDLQPQCRFSCFAANDQQCVHQPENIVPELNRQARFAQKRLLVENVSNNKKTLCASLCGGAENKMHNIFTFSRESQFAIRAESCRGAHLLKGLPNPADYDHAVEVEGDESASACFHDTKETRSTGLIEWLHAQNTHTIIIGGLAMEQAVLETAAHLGWYNDNWHIIVNLAACSGYTPEGALKAVYALRQAGITVVASSNELAAAIEAGPSRLMEKVS